MTREEYVAEIEKIQTDLLEIGRKVEESIVRAIAALRTRDLEAAKQVIENDDEVDALYKQVFRELIGYMLEEPRNIRGRTFLIWIAHDLERIADRATNIAERVEYVATGELRRSRGRCSCAARGCPRMTQPALESMERLSRIRLAQPRYSGYFRRELWRNSQQTFSSALTSPRFSLFSVCTFNSGCSLDLPFIDLRQARVSLWEVPIESIHPAACSAVCGNRSGRIERGRAGRLRRASGRHGDEGRNPGSREDRYRHGAFRANGRARFWWTAPAPSGR